MIKDQRCYIRILCAEAYIRLNTRKQILTRAYTCSFFISQRPTVTPNKRLQRRNCGLFTPACGIIFIDSPPFQRHKVDSN